MEAPAEIIIDFETYSRVVLGDSNVYKYADHSSTGVHTMYWSLPYGMAYGWFPGQPFPFAKWWPNVRILAVNAEFELQIWNQVCVPKYGWPELLPSQVECLQARSAFTGLPRSLDDVTNCLGLGGKDQEGHKVMQQICKPKKTKEAGKPVKVDGVFFGGEFVPDEENIQRTALYCERDVLLEQQLHAMVCHLPDAELKLWQAHRDINLRGVPVDTTLCKRILAMAELRSDELVEEFGTLTGDDEFYKPTQIKKMKPWLWEQGVKVHDCTENTLRNAMDNPSVPDHVKRVMEVRLLTRDASISKFQGMLNHANDEGRCQGAHVFYKAGPGRFAGAGVNFLNLRRFDSDVDELCELAERIVHPNTDQTTLYNELKATEKDVIPTLAGMVRLAVCAKPGKKLIVRDYKAIEMRVLHWMAGDEVMLDNIRKFDEGKGEEPYKIAAARIYGKPISDVTKYERRIGKVQILGCGYVAGAASFANFCKNYGIDMPEDQAQELVQLYRRENPLVKRLWHRLERAAIWAFKNPGREARCGVVQWYMRGGVLCCELPSGRQMRYYAPELVETMYGEGFEVVDQRSGNRRSLSLPVMVENVDQAISRDLLADALVRCHKAGLNVVLHVYDEIVLEEDEDSDAGDKLAEIMTTNLPAWAEGLPIAVDGGESKRYTK